MAKGFGISDLASLGFGQVGQLLDTMDMMSKTWSGMALPTALSPSSSIEELDKRISDLRAIEQWLSLNQNMLRSTIQGLEVQRGTIATLQSFGQAMGLSPEARAEGGPLPWDPERLAALFAAAQHPTGSASSGDASSGNTSSGNLSSGSTPAGDARARNPSTAAGASDEGAANGGGQGATQADATQVAQAWWNMLNEQFQQLANAAVGGMAAAGDTGRAAPGATTKPGKRSATAGPARRQRGAKAGGTTTGGASGRKRTPRSP